MARLNLHLDQQETLAMTQTSLPFRNTFVIWSVQDALVKNHSYSNVNNLKHPQFIYLHPFPSCFRTPQRRRKRTHKGLENVKRKNAKASRSSVSRAGGSHSRRRHVEAVTLFEVITMGRSAMQVKLDRLCNG